MALYLVSATSHADVCQMLDYESAANVVAELEESPIMATYCVTCDNWSNRPTVQYVDYARIVPVDSPIFDFHYYVKVDKESIDAAKSYVLKYVTDVDLRFINLASYTSCGGWGVPQYLPNVYAYINEGRNTYYSPRRITKAKAQSTLQTYQPLLKSIVSTVDSDADFEAKVTSCLDGSYCIDLNFQSTNDVRIYNERYKKLVVNGTLIIAKRK